MSIDNVDKYDDLKVARQWLVELGSQVTPTCSATDSTSTENEIHEINEKSRVALIDQLASTPASARTNGDSRGMSAAARDPDRRGSAVGKQTTTSRCVEGH
jgi:hypothetical protein